jgi:eukaryotic-like serine/threonine-protein kinase
MRMPALTDGGPLKIGAPFADKYEITGLIGHGGQAWVYRGRHAFTAREVAIKIIHAPYGVTHEMLERAKAEAQALAKLNHTNVVTMHDAGITLDGHLYILMELLEGCSLGAVLNHYGRLGIEETLRLLIQAADAVHQAHKRRIIHRDLKPDNLFVIRGDHEGKGNPLKVLDFGIAKMLDEIGFTTRKDVVIGTVLYMSPEQVQGLPITEQSDIYALGLILWEALIGKRPSVLIFERDLIERGEAFRRPGIADIPPIQAHRIPPLLSELDPDIPKYVSQLAQRAIAKVARQRFSTMGDFATAMRVCLDKYLADVPANNRRPPEGRDLSNFVPKAVEPEEAPVSQRVTTEHRPSKSALSAHVVSAATTARIPASLAEQTVHTNLSHGVQSRAATAPPSPWPLGVETEPIGTHLAVSSAPVTPNPEPPQNGRRSEPALTPAGPTPSSDQVALSRRTSSAGLLKPATPPPVSISPRERDGAVAHANRSRVRKALISGGLIGLLLGPLLVRPTRNIEPVPSVASRAEPLPAVAQPRAQTINGPAASNAPVVAEEDQPAPVALAIPALSASAAAPPMQTAVPAPHLPVKSARIATAKPTDKGEPRSFKLDSGLENFRSPAPEPTASAAHSKKAIYGD